MHNPSLVAVDLGAESCRVSLLRWPGGSPQVQLVHRFSNGPIARNGELHWDIEAIFRGVIEGLKRCAEVCGADPIASVAVDGWAVDYARLQPDGKPIADPFCYRDERTVEAERRAHRLIASERLYALTGVQLLRLNTVYQLFADGIAGIPRQTPWVNLPEYITMRLGGRRVAEFTNATHTQLVTVGKMQWCEEIFAALDLDLGAAPPLVSPGTIVGRVTGELSQIPNFRDTRLIAAACHDTASAIAGIPTQGDDLAFISSGTWSLVGTVLDSSCTSAEAQRANFTNLGGVGRKTCFLKNVNGMWILRQCLESWEAKGHRFTIDELVRECANAPKPGRLLDVDDPNLLLVGEMPARINAQRKQAGAPELPEDRAGILACTSLILHSLAARYAEILRDIGHITRKNLRRVCIVGGGSKNAALNRLTAEASGLDVIIGSAESTTLGNLAIQLAVLNNEVDEATGVRHSAVANWSAELGGAIDGLAVSKIS